MKPLALVASLLLIALAIQRWPGRTVRSSAEPGALAAEDVAPAGLRAPAGDVHAALTRTAMEPEAGSLLATEVTRPLPRSVELAPALVEARQLALTYHARDRAFFGRTFRGGWSIPLEGDDLRKSFALPATLDLDSLAVLVEADTSAVSTELAALCDQYVLAFDEAVGIAVEGSTPDASRERIPAGRKEGDDFHRIRVESDGWHFVFRLRAGENPELVRLWEQGQRLVWRRREAVHAALNAVLGVAVEPTSGTNVSVR